MTTTTSGTQRHDEHHDPHGEAPATPRAGFGSGNRTDGAPHEDANTGETANWRRNARRVRGWWADRAERGSGTGERNGTAASRANGSEAERNGEGAERLDDAAELHSRSGTGSDDEDPASHALIAPVAAADDNPSGAALAARTAEITQEWVDGLRFLNLPLGSPRALLRFAKEAAYNFSHIDAVRAVNITFVLFFTAPVLICGALILWTYFLRLHRAVTAWVITLIVAPFMNRLADWAVPDVLDVSTWTATTWQWVSGGLLAFMLASVGVLRGERRGQPGTLGRIR